MIPDYLHIINSHVAKSIWTYFKTRTNEFQKNILPKNPMNRTDNRIMRIV